jgi:hypothetical protein
MYATPASFLTVNRRGTKQFRPYFQHKCLAVDAPAESIVPDL